ncbi:MAG: VOC family protein [Planctomycetota bacterium]
MRVEHIGLQVNDPRAMADWYVKHLGFTILRSGGAPAHARFIADSGKHTVLEVYNNSKVAVPDYRKMDPLLIHLALEVKDAAAERKRLIAAGATAEGDPIITPDGDDIANVRDPWGLVVQLVRRNKPL